MSLPKTATVFGPSWGPKPVNSAITNMDVVDTVTGALRSTYGEARHAAKLLARNTGKNVEAARNWLEGRNAPRAAELIQLMRDEDAVFDAVCSLIGRQERISATQLTTIKEALKILEECDANDLGRGS